jgi:hypothetical protein
MNLKSRFKPRAEAGLLSQLVQTAWQDYQDRIASAAQQAEVAETIAQYFETLITPSDFEVLERFKCISWHERANVRVYDSTRPTGPYAEAFGVDLPRKVPVVGVGGYGYPSIAACEPDWGTQTPLRQLDSYFAALLTARKQYHAEYKISTQWPAEYGKEQGAVSNVGRDCR